MRCIREFECVYFVILVIEILVKKVLSIIELVGVVMKVEGNVSGSGSGLLLLFEFDDKVFLVDLVVL